MTVWVKNELLLLNRLGVSATAPGATVCVKNELEFVNRDGVSVWPDAAAVLTSCCARDGM